MVLEQSIQDEIDSNPSIIKEKDEYGATLLHHAALLGRLRNEENAIGILTTLFNCKKLDFTVKDKDGNTPLHVAAFNCDDKVTCRIVFPALVREAARRQFDFSTKGQNGQSVLHIAARTSYTGLSGRINNVENVLKNAPKPGLDVLSRSGATAFYYAVNERHLEEAHSLLDAGADPFLYGAEDRNPVAMIERHLESLHHDQDYIAEPYIESLNQLKSKMDDFKRKMDANANKTPLIEKAKLKVIHFFKPNHTPPNQDTQRSNSLSHKQ